ncbi:hypothetical protein L8O18_06115 [Enterobacter asburiae]|nr:hypothetical protein [Enterobacter asburiae]
MKLIEFLVSKGREGWCWPNGITKAAVMLGGGAVSFFYNDSLPPALSETLISPRYFRDHECVTREQYEAALAASKPEWNGEGLPPVGCECEVVDNDGLLRYGHGESGEVIAHIENTAVIRMSYGLGCFNAGFLRPIRSEADKRRDEAIESIKAMLIMTMETTRDLMTPSFCMTP